MTILIADNSPRISYTATSGQTAFTVPFEFFDNTDLNVYINDTLQTLTTHYTVTGGSGSTGSITLVTGATAGDIVVITRDVTLERTTDFPTSGPFQVASLNTELDKVVAMIADMKDLADRGLRLSDSDTSAALVLANKDDRKGTVLAFNETTGAVEIGPTIADTNSIAQIKADIALLADIQDGTVATNAITTVSSISSDVTTVSSNNANVTTVAGQTTNMQNITDNLTDVQNAATNAATATTKAGEAAASAVSASFSEAGANTSETNAATSATNASNSASAASTSASAASTSATAAASSATAAASSETNAGTSETNAATSATNAATSATNAGTSETNAASSATAAAASATSASNAQTAAESARDSALASFDSFDDRYLGTKTSDPTVDNDGDALVAGALYFNSTDGEMKVYNGTSWVDAYADGASLVSKSGDTMTGDLSFGDNNKAIFGAGNDLQIYHTGSDSVIQDAGQGDLYIKASNNLWFQGNTSNDIMARFQDNAAVTLYYDNSAKLATTSTGVDVTGGLNISTGGTGLAIDSSSNAYMVIDRGASNRRGELVFSTASADVLNAPPLSATADWALGVSDSDELAGDAFYIGTASGAGNAKMVITQSGNAGIGTTSPEGALHIVNSGLAAQLRVSNTTADATTKYGTVLGSHYSNSEEPITGMLLTSSSSSTGGSVSIGGGISSANAVNNIKFYTAANNTTLTGSERMTITSTGLVGIGSTAPDKNLVVSGSNGAEIVINDSDATPNPILRFRENGSTSSTISTSSQDLIFSTPTTERMRITSGGTVGIGTNSPDANSQLHIKKTGANAKITLETDESNDCYINFSGATSEASIGYEPTSNTIVFANAADGLTSNERMRIDNSGNVGIGTSSPTDLLHLYKFQSDVGMRLQGSNASFYIENNYTQDALSFTRNTSEFMRLESDADLHVDGNVVAYSTTISDIRLKKDIAPIEDAVTKVQQLNGCTFTYLKDDRKSAGLIAQDVEKVLPSAVIEDEAVFHGEEGEIYKTVQYDQLIGLLVEAVKELKAEIEELKDASSK